MKGKRKKQEGRRKPKRMELWLKDILLILCISFLFGGLFFGAVGYESGWASGFGKGIMAYQNVKLASDTLENEQGIEALGRENAPKPATIPSAETDNVRRKITMLAPAVTSADKGTVANITVEVSRGDGRVMINTNPFMMVDLQESAQAAKEAVEWVLGRSLNDTDVIVTISTEAPVIGGPSAGAVISIGLLSALTDKPLRSDVMMSAGVNSRGLLLPVGKLFEKAKAVREHGGKAFIIAKGQRWVQIYRVTETTNRTANTTATTKETKPVNLDLIKYAKDEWELEVVEAETLSEALEYYTKTNNQQAVPA